MKEFKLSPEMDRVPQVNQPIEEQIVDVARDALLLQSIRRVNICGCPQCLGGAAKDHETLRPTDSTEPVRLAPVPRLLWPGDNA